jgi:hypothetical protein
MDNDLDQLSGKELLSKARHIALLCNDGLLNYDEAKRQCKPILDLFNTKGKEIAKKHNQRYSRLTFASLRRY